jgi:glycosyltransferase involved in cell wall biosynthesis
VAAKALSVPERLARKILKPKPFAPTTSAANPNRGDKLLIMADWHSSDHAFVDYVLELKQRGVVLGQICYDMLPIITPQYSGHATDSFTNYVRKVYPVCDLVLAISNNTKKDIAEWLAGQNLNVPRIEVFRLGDDFKMSEPLQPENIFTDAIKKQDDFLLCVGTIEARKNHALLYYTYKLAAQRNIALPNLIIVGRRGWRSEDIYEIMKTDPITKSQFIFLENASDEELAWLYQNCKFSVYPSFYEGWGLPIAESITYGTPCVASNSSSMPEIAGDLIQYFSPASADECLATISDMLLPGNIDKAKQKLKSYNPISWDQTFEFIDKQIGEIGARND